MLAGLGWLHEQEAPQSEVKNFMSLNSISCAADDILNFKMLMRSSRPPIAHKCILTRGRHAHFTVYNRHSI